MRQKRKKEIIESDIRSLLQDKQESNSKGSKNISKLMGIDDQSQSEFEEKLNDQFTSTHERIFSKDIKNQKKITNRLLKKSINTLKFGDVILSSIPFTNISGTTNDNDHIPQSKLRPQIVVYADNKSKFIICQHITSKYHNYSPKSMIKFTSNDQIDGQLFASDFPFEEQISNQQIANTNSQFLQNNLTYQTAEQKLKNCEIITESYIRLNLLQTINTDYVHELKEITIPSAIDKDKPITVRLIQNFLPMYYRDTAETNHDSLSSDIVEKYNICSITTKKQIEMSSILKTMFSNSLKSSVNVNNPNQLNFGDIVLIYSNHFNYRDNTFYSTVIIKPYVVIYSDPNDTDKICCVITRGKHSIFNDGIAIKIKSNNQVNGVTLNEYSKILDRKEEQRKLRQSKSSKVNKNNISPKVLNYNNDEYYIRPTIVTSARQEINTRENGRDRMILLDVPINGIITKTYKLCSLDKSIKQKLFNEITKIFK